MSKQLKYKNHGRTKGKNSLFQIKSYVYFCLVFSTGLQLVQVWPIIYGVNSTQKSTPTLRIKLGLIINRALPEHPKPSYPNNEVHGHYHSFKQTPTHQGHVLLLCYIYACRHKFVEQFSWKSSGAHMARYQKHDVLCYSGSDYVMTSYTLKFCTAVSNHMAWDRHICTTVSLINDLPLSLPLLGKILNPQLHNHDNVHKICCLLINNPSKYIISLPEEASQ